RIVTVDAIRRDVAVVIEVSLETRSTAAVFDRILRAVYFHFAELAPIARRQTPVVAADASESGQLPTADHPIEKPSGVAGKFVPSPEGEVHDPVPAHAMLGNLGVAPVIEQPVALARIGGNRSGQKHVRLLQKIVAPSIAARA